MEYGHSWTNLRDRERNLFFFLEEERERNWVILIEEKRICRCKGVYNVCHMRSLILNEQEVIRPGLGPIEPSFMKMRLQSPCFMDLRDKYIPWTKLAERPYLEFRQEKAE